MKAVIVATDHGTHFKLLRDQMVEAVPQLRDAYSAYRIDLRSALENPLETDFYYTFPHVDGGRATNAVKITLRDGEGYLRIGCKVFTGENFRKLKEWALCDRW